MLTALDTPPTALDEHELSFVSKVKEHGWARTSVVGDDEGPGFSFTTGIWVNESQPELLMFSMKDDIVRDVFWDLSRSAKKCVALPVGVRTDAAFAILPAYLFPVAKKHYANYLGWSRWFYGGDDFPCLHVVWPDRDGVFPWEHGFDAEFRADQPDLTELGWAKEVRD